MRLDAVLCLTVALASSPAAAQLCPSGKTLFVGEASAMDPELKVIAYFPEGQGSSSPMAFEGWHGKTMDWRVMGDYGCSNGVSVCSVSIPLSNGETVDASETMIMEGERPVYMVLSDLMQSTYTVQAMGEAPPTIKAEWPAGAPDADNPDEPAIVLPSIWKAGGCAK